MPSEVAVLLYPGCTFFEVALATETLAPHLPVRFYTPGGEPLALSNGAVVQAAGAFSDLERKTVCAVLVPGGDPKSVLVPENLTAGVLCRAAGSGAWVAGICAGNLLMAAAGLLRGRRGTHNYTPEHATSEQVEATARFWEGMQFERANLVQDGKLITAQPWAYRLYAAVVARELGVLSAEQASNLSSYFARKSYSAA